MRRERSERDRIKGRVSDIIEKRGSHTVIYVGAGITFSQVMASRNLVPLYKNDSHTIYMLNTKKKWWQK